MSNPANTGSVIDQRSSYEESFRQPIPVNTGNYYNSSAIFANRSRETPPQSFGSETPRERSKQFYIFSAVAFIELREQQSGIQRA